MFHRLIICLIFSVLLLAPPLQAHAEPDTLTADSATVPGQMPIAAADVDIAIDPASKKTGDFRILLTDLNGNAASYAYGVITINHNKGLHGILAPSFSYPDETKIMSFPFLAHQGEYRFKTLLWDPGTYSITVTARGVSGSSVKNTVDFSIAPAGESLRNTFVLYGFLVILGLFSGLVGGLAAARRDKKKAAAAMCAVVLIGISLLVPGSPVSSVFTERAYAHSGEEHKKTVHEETVQEEQARKERIRGEDGRIETVKTPVPNGNLSISPENPKPGKMVRLAMKTPAMSTVPVTVNHLEDDLILFSGGIPRDNFGIVRLQMVFPEGNSYSISGGAFSKKFKVQAVDPQFSAQMMSLGTMMSALIFPMLLAYIAGRFVIGNPKGEEEDASSQGKRHE